jgi:hypothetical protein
MCARRFRSPACCTGFTPKKHFIAEIAENAEIKQKNRESFLAFLCVLCVLGVETVCVLRQKRVQNGKDRELFLIFLFVLQGLGDKTVFMHSQDRLDSITRRIIGAAIEVHRTIGPGLLESAYAACLSFELCEMGLGIKEQEPLPVIYKDV